ncbi:hypothetical protein HO999_07720 [Streptococcus suis]|nr:hypothetical protein [Streptococcus suis]NQN72617.1 hypothetical protein [Streptococcus suis]NQN73975.1 hypothetical protein [Streptococcus suis]NQN78925.1 hypothetical protein [Streptococcus suis]
MLTEEQLQDIFELADLMSNSDRELFLQLRDVVFASDPNHILDRMEQILDDQSFDDFLDKIGESEKENLWVILLTLLDHFHYIAVRPKSDELNVFINTFDRLQQVRNAGILLKLDSAGLLPNGSISEWSAIIDGKYASEGFCVGAIDMKSDSYYLFFNKLDQFERIKELAKRLEYRVDFAKVI